MIAPTSLPENSTNHVNSGIPNVLALLLATVATGGSLYLSMGLGLKACPLCFYQRSFAMGAVLVLILQLWLDGVRSPRAAIITLPLVVSGLGIAAFHVYLVQADKLECPPALFGWGDGPLQSLLMFVSLTLVCFAGVWSARRTESGNGFATVVAVVILSCIAAWACIASAPPHSRQPQSNPTTTSNSRLICAVPRSPEPECLVSQQSRPRMTQQVEIIVRLSFFAGTLFIMSVWELAAPRRRLAATKIPRWTSNLGLVALNTVANRLLIPVTAVAAAILAESRGWGLLHLIDWPSWLEVVLAVLAFDLAINLQHVMFHAVPALWRLHMVSTTRTSTSMSPRACGSIRLKSFCRH